MRAERRTHTGEHTYESTRGAHIHMKAREEHTYESTRMRAHRRAHVRAHTGEGAQESIYMRVQEGHTYESRHMKAPI